jgi:hypothetical protein
MENQSAILDTKLAEFNMNMMKSWSGDKHDTNRRRIYQRDPIKGEEGSLGGK